MDSMEGLTIIVSPVCVKDGERYAFVNFEVNGRWAEGKIPDCKIVSNKGFSDMQVELLEDYMKDNLPSLKRNAAEINPLRNIFGFNEK